MQDNVRKSNKKQKVVLLSIILLLCISGVGVFFLLQKGKSGEVDEVVYQGKWDVSWYDENEKEFTITTKEQLLGFAELSKERNFHGQTIKLGADIVLNEGNAENWKESAPEIKWIPIGNAKFPFRGVFDGQNHTISGIYVNHSDEASGFFSETGVGSEVKNLKILNSYYKMRGDQGVGSVTGVGIGLFSQIYSDAIVECEGWRAGGIMGSKSKNGGCTVTECWFDGELTLSGRLGGGIAGGVYAGECIIQHCLNTGTIMSTFPGPQAATIGGIAGYIAGNARLTIADCFNNGLLSNAVDRPEVASLLGAVGEESEVIAGYNWSTTESAEVTVGTVHGSAVLKGLFLSLSEKHLTGFEAYKRTELDFEKYWAVVEDGTPMLQFFAEEIPSVEGVTRCLQADTSWYDITKPEQVISTAEQLKGFSVIAANGDNFYGKVIKLGADIKYNSGDAESYAKEIPQNLWYPVDNFLGTFDGQGHTISGLFVNSAMDHVGMFSFTESKTVIKNFKLTNSYFERTATSGNYGCASVSGAGGGTFEKIYSEAIIVTGNMNGGGIVGQFNRNGSVSECWFNGEIAAKGRFAGGIVGGAHPYMASGTTLQTIVSISHCLNTGYIHRTDKDATNNATYAGIIGLINSQVTLDDCFNAGRVVTPKIEKKERDELGAITAAAAANSKATIKNCWGTTESFERVLSAISGTSVTSISCTRILPKQLLTGYGAVNFTTLDFNKYWSVDLQGTPVLKCFAKASPSIAGIIKPDVSWYNEDKTEFVITTPQQLYGFSIIANSDETFEGKTVKLGKDITVNTGDASTWNASAPTQKWFPIRDFAGTFDGQGYTVSGLYSVDTPNENIGRGFFTKTVEQAVLKNFRLVNSYFETQTIYAVAAVSSRGCGTFKNIYTNAIVNNTCDNNTGGIIGLQLWASATIENCWFDGQITTVGSKTGGIVGNTGAGGTSIANCLFSGTVSRVGDKVDESFGFVGGIVGSANGNVSISDCLSVGKVSSERKKEDVIGSLVGEAVKKSNVKLNELYASENSCSKMIGYNGAGSNVSTCTMLSERYLTSVNVSLLTNLDYANYWVVVKGTSPQLKSFATGDIVTNPKTPDTSWYKADATSYIISDIEDLYGLRMLSETVSFEGKVINMDRDIPVNAAKEGQEAEGWKASAPEYLWMPIQNFKGEFNGNGFAISGLFGVAVPASTGGMGLFAKTAGEVNIHDFSLMNSYFESSDANGLAAIASQASGTFTKIHTNAILYNDNTGYGYMGGIVGKALGTIVIKDCWSEASITGAGRYAGGMLSYSNGKKVTIEHCLNTGKLHRFGDQVNAGRAGYGGIIGTATAGNTVTINDCLNTGNVTSERTVNWDLTGQIAAEGPSASDLLVITNSYGLEGACVNGLVKGYGEKAKIENSVIIPENKLLGLNAYSSTTLDFMDECHWVIKCDANGPNNEFPGLKVFVPNEKEYDLSEAIQYDISWYDTTTKTGTITDKWDLYGMYKLANVNAFTANTVITLGKDIVFNNVTDQTDISAWKTTVPDETWTPIENFAGEFDGDGFAIRGLYGEASADTNRRMGLFGKLAVSANIHDLHITNSYFVSDDVEGLAAIAAAAQGTIKNVHTDVILENTNTGWNRVAGIAGFAVGTLTIEDCWSESTITVAGRFVGGILGHTNKHQVTIQHCLNTGKLHRNGSAVNGDRAAMGGILGIATADKIVTINDCLNTGNVTTERTVNWDAIGQIAGEGPSTQNSLQVTNCYALEGACVNGLVQSYGDRAKVEKSVIMSENKLLGLNAYHNMTLDFADECHWVIKCDANGQTNEFPGLEVFVPDEKEYDLSGTIQYDTSWYDTTTKIGTITDKWDLYGMYKLANLNAFTANTVITLGNDIVLNNVTDQTDISAWKTTAPNEVWTPITDFSGIFDGQGYTISGIYVKNTTEKGAGLFRSTAVGSTIKNLRIEKSYIYSSQPITGSVVGSCSGNLENIYSSATVHSTKAFVGGIVGNVWTSTSTAANPLTISKCWFDGNLDTSAGNNGGIVGIISKGYVEISNCLNSGTLMFKDAFTGGIVGRTYNAADKWCNKLEYAVSIYLTMENCLNRGTMSGTAGLSWVGSIIGRLQCCGKFTVESVYLTEESDTYHSSVTWIGEGSTTDNSEPTIYAQSAITVQDLNNANEIKAIKDKLTGFDFDTTWTIGSKGTPELFMSK